MAFGSRYHGHAPETVAKATGGFGARYAGGSNVPVAAPGSGFGGRYAAVPPSAAKAKTQHGVGGFIHNVGADVASTIAGIPMGIVQTVEHPVRSAKQIGRSYAQTYGPLTHGDVSKFVHNLYEHPLGPALDVATLLTAGAGGAARAGSLLGKAGVIAEESKLAQLGRLGKLELKQGEKTITVPTSRNPAIRARKAALKKALDRLPEQFPHVGSVARFAKEVDRLPRLEAVRHRQALIPYNQAVRKLRSEEIAALHLIMRGVHPTDYLALLRKQGHVEPEMLKVLQNPKIIELVDNPTKKMIAAHSAADTLAQFDAQLKTAHGVLDPEMAAARPGKHQDYAREQLGDLKPLPLHPVYVPDVPVVSRVTNPGFAKQGGGLSVQNMPGSAKANKGVLFRTGRLALHPDILGPEYLRTVKYGLFDDIHSEIMSASHRVSRQYIQEHGLPEGYDFVRKKVVSATGKPRAQQIHPLVRKSGEIKQQFEDLQAPEDRTMERGFHAENMADAERIHGDYLIAPKRLLKDLGGEFTRSNAATRLFLENPTKVWRAIILGYRVGFLTNNVVGNHLMYAIRFAGRDGLLAYLNAVKSAKGLGAVKTLLEDPKIPRGISQEFMREFFPDQVEGSFGATNKPRFKSPRFNKTLSKAGTGIVPATQAASEGVLRRAGVEASLRHTPEVRAILKKMPRETKSLEAASKQAMKENPLLAREVSDKVNAALGNYLNLSHFERHQVRAVIPFYAWYRAIAGVTYKMAADTPGRADAIAKLGQIGSEDTEKILGALPSYLRGLIPIGKPKDGKARVMSTAGLNPLGTITTLGAGVTGLLTGKPGETGKALSGVGLNPIIQAAIENATGKDLFTGKAITGGPRGLPAQTVVRVGSQLPQAQFVQAVRGKKKTKTYGKQSVRDAVLAQLGVPTKTLDLTRAHQGAKREGR